MHAYSHASLAHTKTHTYTHKKRLTAQIENKVIFMMDPSTSVSLTEFYPTADTPSDENTK